MNSTPQQEIERKWLLKSIPYLNGYDEVISIQQFYVEIDNKPCRIRFIMNSKDESNNVKIEVIHKENIGYGSNIEHHYDISREEADAIIDSQENVKIIHKTRYVKYFEGYKIEIDQFYNMSLILMEVEIPHIDFPIKFDELVQKEILMEVTGNKIFNNYNLAE